MSAYLTPADVADLLGCSHDTVLRAIARGHLRAVRYGRLVRIAQADLDAFLAANTAAPKRRRLRTA